MERKEQLWDRQERELRRMDREMEKREEMQQRLERLQRTAERWDPMLKSRRARRVIAETAAEIRRREAQGDGKK